MIRQVLVGGAIAGLMLASSNAASAQRIAYIRQDPLGSQVWVSNSNGSMQRQVTRDNWNSQNPALSPDGRQITCSGYRDGRQALFLVDTLTGARRVLVSGLVNIGESAWSPDGRRVAFRAAQEANNAIFVVNADGTGLRALTPDINYRSPAWGPDGGTIAYIALEYKNSKQWYIINFVNLATGATRSIELPFVGPFTNDGFFISELDWSANGAYIALEVLSKASNTTAIYRIAPDGSGLRRLTGGTENGDYNPSISPDSRSILYSHPTPQGNQLRVMNADGTGQRLLFSEIGYSQPDWSAAPDIKGSAPRIAIGSPTHGATANRLFSISGRAVDADAGSKINLTIMLRASNGRYWNGRDLQVAPFAIPTTRASIPSAGVALSWSAGSPTFFQNLPAGVYVATAQALDDAGLTAQATASVRVLAPSTPRA